MLTRCFAVLLFLPSVVVGQEFVVVNKMPPAITVTNKMPRKQPCNLCDSCECLYCACPAVAKPAPVAPPVVKAPEKTQTVFTTRAPVGHTHTCRNGHTWDHAANPTHNCQFCGASQYVQDRSPRMVTITRTVRVPDASVPPARTTTRAAWSSTASAVVASPGGCASGNCAVTYIRR